MLVVRVHTVGGLPRFRAQLDQLQQIHARNDRQSFVLRRIAERHEGPVQRVLGHRLQLWPMASQIGQQNGHAVRVALALGEGARDVLSERDQFFDWVRGWGMGIVFNI